MTPQIIEGPFCVSLVGLQGTVQAKRYGEVGRRLMGELWPQVRSLGIKTTGINHWVYLSETELFTGVELAGPASELGTLKPLRVELPRHLRYVHQGPYSELPAAWKKVMDRLHDQGQTPMFPNLEIYGHWNDDPSQLMTTIVVGLAPRGR